MLSNDLHLRLHYREMRRPSGVVTLRRMPATASGIPFWIRDMPRTGETVTAAPLPSSLGLPEAAAESDPVEAQWQDLLRLWPHPDEVPGCPPSPRPLIEAVMQYPELRCLYPFTRAYTLCFRRPSDAPAMDPLPTAAPIDRDYYQALVAGSYQPLCEGSAEVVANRMAQFVMGR